MKKQLPKNIYTAFTLIELLLIITIITISVVWVNQLNFNFLTEKQKLDIFVHKIQVGFEEIRSNALLGKRIGDEWEVPKKWKMELSKNGNGSIKMYYYDDTWTNYDDVSIMENYTIKEISCWNIDDTLSRSVEGSDIWIIEIEWGNISLTWTCGGYKKLRWTLEFKNAWEKTFEINTLSWLMRIL